MADYQYLNETGVIVPDTATVLSDVESEFKAALGQDLITTPNTPQGALITVETLARSNVLQNNALVANQINPNLAGGVFLDAIWALTGGAREAATYSYIVGVSLGGLAGTTVPAGSQASLADGTLFASVSDVVLDGSGLGSVDFQAVEAGPVAASVGALNQIVSGVLGWDTVSNTNAATLGRLVESDLASRQRRKNTLSLQNVALPEAITSALYDTNGVRSLTFRENVTASTATIDGISMLAKSIYVCVDGGTDADVAAALLEHKSLGCNWNGTTTVAVVNAASGQTYSVKFSRPTLVPVQARLYVRNLSALSDVTTAVNYAIVNYAAGLIDGEPGFTVGADVSAFELAGAVNAQTPGIYVQKCEISLLSVTSWSTNEIAIGIDSKATILPANVQVIIV